MLILILPIKKKKTWPNLSKRIQTIPSFTHTQLLRSSVSTFSSQLLQDGMLPHATEDLVTQLCGDHSYGLSEHGAYTQIGYVNYIKQETYPL